MNARSFKSYVMDCSKWVAETYGVASYNDLRNRAARVAEEGVELAQSEGVPKEQVLAIVERCYSRPVGDPRQEGAGVLFTVMVWSHAKGVSLIRDLSRELKRVKAKDPEHFRAKHREKFAAGTDLVPPV